MSCSSGRLENGVLAQLVERLVRNEKVRGSNPLGSTINFGGFFEQASCFARNTRFLVFYPPTGGGASGICAAAVTIDGVNRGEWSH